MTKQLVILFGHANDQAGAPSAAAVARCTQAVEFYRNLGATEPIPDLLITGAFGANFNATASQHHLILREYFLSLLKSGGVGRAPMIFGAPTSFTLEDVAYARKLALLQGHTSFVCITNAFHLPRVRIFMQKLLPEYEARYLSAADPPDLDPGVIRKEHSDTTSLESGREWADVPLPDKNYVFPAEIYKNAFEEHKHGDTVSYWILAAAFSVMLFPSLKAASSALGPTKPTWFFAGALLGYLCWKLYLRYAAFAKISRLVMRLIETIYFAPGFSYNHVKYYAGYGLRTSFNTRNVLGTITGLLIALNLARGIGGLLPPEAISVIGVYLRDAF